MPLPSHGRPAADVLAELDRLRTSDVRWRAGRVFSLAYFASDEIHDLAAEVYGSFMTENALNTDAFPSLRHVQADVVEIVNGWLEGGPEAAGFMTSGGTESILLAVKAARERGRAERGVDRPNMVLPTTAHAAFEKGGYYFGVETRRVPVGDDWRADPAAMAERIDHDTVLVVASAPQYPQGVIDPVPAVAALAAEHDINCHVDACMGGVVLPYLERLGEAVPPWNFRVEGVTSMSVDLHKYGYAGKGASVLMHRSKALRRYQTFVTDNWLGGLYGSSGILGTKGGGPLAAAWAVLQAVGDTGYLRLAGSARRSALALADAIDSTPGLVLRARPDSTLVAFGTDGRLDAFAVADVLAREGWYVDRQGPPDSLHCTVHAGHEPTIDGFIDAVRLAAAEVGATTSIGLQGNYGTVD